MSASTALITNNLNGVISNTAILKSDLDSLSSQYTQTNDNLIDLQNDFSDFSNDVNDYFETNNENITEMSGKIENINSFNGVWTDNTLSGDGLNTPLSVTNVLPDNLYDMLSALSSVLSDSAQHPNAMIGMTGGQFGWIDLG